MASSHFSSFPISYLSSPTSLSHPPPSPPLQASVKGHEEIGLLLLEAYPTLAQFKDKTGKTALHWAACYGHTEFVRLILLADPSVSQIANKDGRTPLAAVVAQQRSLAEHVDGLAAHSRTQQHQRQRPQQQQGGRAGGVGAERAERRAAARHEADVMSKVVFDPMKHAEIIRMLIDADPDPTKLAEQDEYGNTALHRSAADGQLEIARCLVDALGKFGIAKVSSPRFIERDDQTLSYLSHLWHPM
jgi:ankyrin repeat protein